MRMYVKDDDHMIILCKKCKNPASAIDVYKVDEARGDTYKAYILCDKCKNDYSVMLDREYNIFDCIAISMFNTIKQQRKKDCENCLYYPCKTYEQYLDTGFGCKHKENR